MIKISELKEGDVLKSGAVELTVLLNLGKAVVVEHEYKTLIYSEKELNKAQYKLVPLTPEKKYFMGFEVREYPERPIVEVNDYKGGVRNLRRLIKVVENFVYCEDVASKSPCRWAFIYRIPETIIVEPTSSGTREGDGC